jgi:hypothetical protein
MKGASHGGDHCGKSGLIIVGRISSRQLSYNRPRPGKTVGVFSVSGMKGAEKVGASY